MFQQAYRARLVIILAVIPDQLDIIEDLLHETVLVLLQLEANQAQVHRFRDDLRVVHQPKA